MASQGEQPAPYDGHDGTNHVHEEERDHGPIYVPYNNNRILIEKLRNPGMLLYGNSHDDSAIMIG